MCQIHNCLVFDPMPAQFNRYYSIIFTITIIKFKYNKDLENLKY